MSKHTPGPWYIDPIKANANGNRRIMAEQCTPVAVVPDHLVADARLIAAAPDLLEVLKAFSDYVRDEQMATDGAVTYPTTAINHWAFLARAAIAKATGGEV
jgi:hypothetical protein